MKSFLFDFGLDDADLKRAFRVFIILELNHYISKFISYEQNLLFRIIAVFSELMFRLVSSFVRKSITYRSLIAHWNANAEDAR